MSQVTVEQLASVVGVPVERLLQQMQDAGLPHTEQRDSVSDNEKKVLLAYLKESHGSLSDEPKKITLSRKSKSTLKVSGSQGRSKTVNVEVRKKRTYVKRSSIEEEQQAQIEREQLAAEQAAALEKAKLEAEEARRAAEAAAQEAARREEEEAYNAKVAKQKADAEAKAKADAKKKAAEKARQSAQKTETEEERLAREKAEAARKQVDEERRRMEAEARRKADEEAAKATLEQAKKIAAELEARGGDRQYDTEFVGIRDSAADMASRVEEESYSAEERRSRRVIKQKKRLKLKNKHVFQAPIAPKVVEVNIPESILISDLAQRMSVKAGEVVKTLFNMGMAATINQAIDQDTAVLVVSELGHSYKLTKEDAIEDELAAHLEEESVGESTHRAPVVTVMGHVDHGKTSLLDYIRRTKVAAGEAGGITQHVAAYQVSVNNGLMTFLDTPGHAAFSAMRARGANCTDIVVLVVAADDGVMPQTEEAISHARAANVPIVVAINKIDKQQADPDRVRNELVQRELIPDDWGGDTQFVEVSAHTGQGIDNLLSALAVQAEIMELSAHAEGPAKGVVLEARVDKGRGVIADLLVQRGQLKPGDMVLAGSFYGRVRAMINEKGENLEVAGPSVPVQILGLAGAPEAGEEFSVVPDERKAREVAQFREIRQREAKLARRQSSRLENMFSTMQEQDAKAVNIVLKADVRGSLEALTTALEELGTDQVTVKVVGSSIGAINESDVSLAVASGAFILGFNVRADASAKKMCQEEEIDLRYYSVIYDVIDDVKRAMVGLLAPERREEIVGIAEVREVYRSSKFGAVAGCMVVEGTVFRKKPIRVLRDDVVVFQGELESLRRFKDDVSEVRNGVECGIAVKSYNDVKPGDKIEVYEVKEIARTL